MFHDDLPAAGFVDFVVVKVAVVLFVIGLGITYVDKANWGTDWASFAPNGFSGVATIKFADWPFASTLVGLLLLGAGALGKV